MKSIIVILAALTVNTAFAQNRTVCRTDYMNRTVCETTTDPFALPRHPYEQQRMTCKYDYLNRLVCDSN